LVLRVYCEGTKKTPHHKGAGWLLHSKTLATVGIRQKRKNGVGEKMGQYSNGRSDPDNVEERRSHRGQQKCSN